MATKTITQLPAAAPTSAAEIPYMEGGVTKKATPAQLADLTMGDNGVFALAELAEVATITATGTAFTGACEYRGFTVRAISGTPQTVTVYDATSATGTPVHTQAVSATGYYPWAGNARRPMAAGCHVVISGGSSRTLDVLVGAA